MIKNINLCFYLSYWHAHCYISCESKTTLKNCKTAKDVRSDRICCAAIRMTDKTIRSVQEGEGYVFKFKC